MYFLLILFFASLLGITFMIGRKLLMLQNGQALQTKQDFFQTSSLEEWRYSVVKNIKRYGYSILVTIIRLYLQFTNFLKNEYKKIKTRVQNTRSKKLNADEKREVSKFLKKISEYKYKIREIKHKIKEEESL